MKNKKSRGQTFVENCIIWGLVCVVAIGILTTFGGTIRDILFKSKEQVRGFQPFGVPTEASANDTDLADSNAMDDNSDGPGLPDVDILTPPGFGNSDTNDVDDNDIDLNVDDNDLGDLGAPGDPGNEIMGHPED